MADASPITRLVPGFDFLQGLVKNAGSALPSIGQWIAPTLNPEELEKRIEELRTVQFWLEQNARMLGATIQALEVQRMTLSTLKTMNVQMEDLRESLRIKVPTRDTAAPGAASWPAGRTSAAFAAAPEAVAPAPADKPARAAKVAKGRAARGADAAAKTAAVDPMQWWGALTKQFTQLAAGAMKDSATDAAKTLATSMVKQSFDAAGETLKQAAQMPARAVRKVAPGSPAGSPKAPRTTSKATGRRGSA
jgi:hypothetical protein